MTSLPVKQLILASSSPFRQRLLAQTGLSFEAKAPLCDERAFQAADPKTLASLRSREKGKSIAQAYPGTLVIGADQTLGFGAELLEKVETAAEAFQVLKKLQGHSHELHTAFTLLYQESPANNCLILHEELLTIPMQMRSLTDQEISAYIATEEWRGCVGCCRAEGKGVHLLEPPSDYCEQSAIVGLPLRELLKQLRELGICGLTNPQPPWQIVPKNFYPLAQ